jgi:hypothetical protein
VLGAILICLVVPSPALAQHDHEGEGEADDQRLSEPLRGGARIPALEVRLEEPGVYRTHFEVAGETFRCDAPLSEGDPCVLRNVPAGTARMFLESTDGDHRVDTPVVLRTGTREVMVEEGVTIDGTVGYAFVTLGVVFAAPGTYLFIAATCDPTDRSCAATQTVGVAMGVIGLGFALSGLYMLVFGTPYELYGADVRRDTRPAISTDPAIDVGDPVGDPPQDTDLDEGATQPGETPPPPPSTTETESEGDDDAAEEAAPPASPQTPAQPPATPPGPSAALGISGTGMSFTLWF